ncbi:MAG: HDOD domain-containing protein [Anaerolineae bacterium]|nr:HDOD domain-containing protein [Phycisphaerae bacterium]
MDNLRERIRTCDSLPTLPAAALRVLQLTVGDKGEPQELAQLIVQDPGLSGRVLRAVNSPFYGMSNKVSSVQQAVALLGVHSVKTLVLGFTLVSTLQNQRAGSFDYFAYWRRSMYAATAARVIAAQVTHYLQEDCFISALLMDIGALLLNQLMEERYGFIYDRAKTHQELIVIESHELGLTHAEAGALLAEHWKLPPRLSTPIAAHHNPHDVEDNELKKITQVIWLAGRCAEIFVNPKEASDSISAVRRSLRELFQLDEIRSDALLCQVSMKTSELAGLFDVRVNTSVTYDQILAGASERLLEMSIADENGKANADNRRNKRLRRDGKVTITPCSRGILDKPVQVKLRDLSATGIGVTHTDRMELETQFIIQLPQPDKSVKSLLYTVKRCDTFGGLSSIGAELTSVLRPESVPKTSAAQAA